MTSRRCFEHQVVLIVLAVVLAGCGRRAEVGPSEVSAERSFSDPVRVVASTPIVAELVKRIGRGGVEVEVLVPVGESPGALRRTGPVESRLVAAELVVVLGLGQEEPLAVSLARAKEEGTVVCELGLGLPSDRLFKRLGEGGGELEGGGFDPQIWLDPGLWALATHSIEAALSALRPEWAGEFRKQAHAGRFELEEEERLLQRRAKTMVPSGSRPIRAMHPGLRYLARSVGIALIVEPEARPLPGEGSPKDELAKLALDELKPPGSLVVATALEHDVGTLEGLRGYALDLLLERLELE